MWKINKNFAVKLWIEEAFQQILNVYYLVFTVVILSECF
jgi:hypothetical protein